MLLSKYFSVQAPIVQQASLLVVMVQARVLAQQGDVQQAPLLVVESASNKCSTSTLACCKKSANKGVCTTRKCSTSIPACCKKLQTRVFAQQGNVQQAPLLVARKVQTRVFAQQENVQQAPLLVARKCKQGCLHNKSKSKQG